MFEGSGFLLHIICFVLFKLALSHAPATGVPRLQSSARGLEAGAMILILQTCWIAPAPARTKLCLFGGAGAVVLERGVPGAQGSW